MGSGKSVSGMVCLAVALAGATGAASAQIIERLFPFLAPSAPATDSAPPKVAGAPDWSGQSGSSGHPLMTAEAILAAAANFNNCLDSLWPDAARRGITRETFDSQTRDLTPDLRIMDLMDAQPEFTKAFWDYLDLLVNDGRIKRGHEILAQHRAVFDAMEKTYGVDRHIVTAIWGVESNFSTSGGDRPVVRSTATLACVGRRQAYFRDEFLAALEIVDRGDISPDRLKGSWAGAFGPTQFMPTSFKRFAVDFDGDGRRDVVDSAADLIASTANNLKTDGWTPSQTWGYEVVLPDGFNYLLADSSKIMTAREWERLGVTRVGGRGYPRPTDRAYLLVPAGAAGPAFLMLNNFKVLMKYNPAEAYALAIGHLADRMRGDGPIVAAWPRGERVLTAAERYELQQHLVRLGFDIGSEPNGRINAKSRSAIKGFQVSQGLVPDGFASADLLERLRRP
ncbi:MAG TPA: lytic murein transglycosylase [Xanthobacteraceae bacterium]|nr:lytic murein transglycosylase [Xanthobacteraceae bacterium]